MRKAKKLLVIALLLCLISGIGANLIQTGGGKVSVTELTIPGSDGAMISGVLYKPVDASADHKLPLIIANHGSFNNKEMQDQNLIELSRRGFIVFAPDSYRHGKSSIHNENMGEYQSLVDSVEALYDLNYVDQSKVALVGHSMGADQSNNTAKYYISQEALGNGKNKIAAVLSVGCDPAYTSYEVEGLEDLVPVTIDYGTIEAKYDEFFYHQEDVGSNPARYLESANALSFVRQVEPTTTGAVEDGKIYKGTIGDDEYIRVIYQSNEIHPLNHFSTETAASTVEFFYEALGVPDGHEKIDSGNQVWYIKEIFNLVGLVGLFLFIAPFAYILLQTAFFKEVVSEREIKERVLTTKGEKVNFWIVYALVAAIPAILFIPVTYHLIGKETFVPAIYNKVFGEANINELSAWSAIAGIVIVLILLANYFIYGKKKGVSLEGWGFKVNVKQFVKALLLAVIVVAGAYGILLVVHYLFGTDFRIWVLAVKTFDVSKLRYILLYFPGYLIFYLGNSIAVNGNNDIKGWKEWQKLLVSCVANIAGLVVILVIQYSSLISDGTIVFNAMRVLNIFPLLVLVPTATIVSRQIFKQTKNIYLGSMIFGLLYAVIACTNTMFMA